MTGNSNDITSIIVQQPELLATIPRVLWNKNASSPNDSICNAQATTQHQVSTLLSGPSRARIGLSNLSIPLAWNSDEYFGTRGEGKIYSMFVVLQATGNVIDSRVVTAVDRTCTDVTFAESFIFENQPVGFEIEIHLYASRTNGGDINQSLKQKLSRSFGRKLGAAYKSSWLCEDGLTFDALARSNVQDGANNNKYFHLLGWTKLTLNDAKPKTGIYDLHLSPNASSYGPPLYGHIRCRVVARPDSVAMPLSDGILTIKPVGEDCMYHNMRCRLQAGVLRCMDEFSAHSNKQDILHICINKKSKVLACRHPRSIIVTSGHHLTGTERGKQYILTSDSEENIAAWRHAIILQIADCEHWGEFAVSSTKLWNEAEKPDVMISSRVSGRRLYDEIQIQTSDTMPGILKNDTCSGYRNPNNTSRMVSFASSTAATQTAPSGRQRIGRAHVCSLFQPVDVGEYRYVINLPIGDVFDIEQQKQTSPTNVNGNGYESQLPDCMEMNGTQYRGTSKQNIASLTNGYGAVPGNLQESFFKGFRKTFQRSFGALRNRKPPVEVSRF